MDERHVVTCFLLARTAAGDRILLLRRSGRVHTYQDRWAAVSGGVETTPDEQAAIEIVEETGLTAAQVRLQARGRPLVVEDADLDRRWIIHPYLFAAADSAAVRLDWEHTEARWIAPADLGRYQTVPHLAETLARVYPAAC